MAEDDPVDSGGSKWYVLHVKPRTEKKAARYLDGFRCFRHLPIRVVLRKIQRRKVRRELPLFPGYVFARMSFDVRRKMFGTNLVVRTIEIPNPRETIHQLRQLRRGLESGDELKVLSRTYHEGEKVRVKAGPLRGTEGYVKREGAKATICLNVAILGSAVEVSISPEDVELVPDHCGRMVPVK